jgi:hypothetical protein
MQQEYLMYKGYPLVRSGKCLYYGFMSDPYVARLQIQHETKQGDLCIADKVKVYQISTDQNLNPMEAIVKVSERESLYDALDVANTWLQRTVATKTPQA